MKSNMHDPEAHKAAKKALGIPQDEPFFVLRAQDKCAASAIQHYLEIAQAHGTTPAFDDQVTQFVRDFVQFGEEHPDKLKVPDIPEPEDLGE